MGDEFLGEVDAFALAAADAFLEGGADEDVFGFEDAEVLEDAVDEGFDFAV